MTPDERIIKWIEGIRSSLAAQAREKGLLPPTDKWDPVDIARRLDKKIEQKRYAGQVKDAEKNRDDWVQRNINSVLNVARGGDASADVKAARRASIEKQVDPFVQNIQKVLETLKPYAKAAGGNIQDALQGKAPRSFTGPGPGPGPAFGDIGGHGSNTAPTTGLIAAEWTDPGAQKAQANEAILNMISQRGSPADKAILSGLDWNRLFQTMAGMPGAHMQHPYGGGSFLTDFAISGEKVAAARSAAALEEEKLRSKERIAGASKTLKPSAELSKLYATVGSAQTGLKNIDEIKKLLSDKLSGLGAAGTAADGINAFVDALNIPLPEGMKEDLNAGKKLNLIVDHLRSTLIEMRIFGREANRQEIAMIKRMIPDSGIFRSKNHLLNAFTRIGNMLSRKQREAAGQLKYYGAPPYANMVNTRQPWTRS